MFSATYSEDIRELASRLLRNPVAIQVAARNAAAERIRAAMCIACPRSTSGTCWRTSS